MQTAHLTLLLQTLESLPPNSHSNNYRVPSLWQHDTIGYEVVNPAEYYASCIRSLLDSPRTIQHSDDDWKRHAVVYNLFIRLTTAFDHNGDGELSNEPMECGFRETGTLLKAIALLPYIERLGANTLYLLPLTAIGEQNRKGSLGSPYAVKNPRTLDPMLAEPALGLSAELLLKAFVEAAHLRNMRVVFEFVFRTAAVDSDWAKEHPEWFYWLKEGEANESFGAPYFEQERLNAIYAAVDRNDMNNLPAPDEAYRAKFVAPPEKVTLRDGALVGLQKDGTTCRIASAFSDWPPDDRQPAWSDVTYLKMHQHENFNYMAYNTIRMYDTTLERLEYRTTALWETLVSIIPEFQDEYHIDGAMIDMGHALPAPLKQTIVEKARAKRPDFAFWDENFNPSIEIRDHGFDAVFGSLPFVINDIIFIRGLLNHLNRIGVALPFFGTGENHNTPRVCFRYPQQAAGRNFATFIFTLSAILPSLPFLQSGMELCEWHPVNLGLNFTDEDRATYPSESLPLFSPRAYDWEKSNNLEPLNHYIKRILTIRERYLNLVLCGDAGSINVPYVSHPELFAVMRNSGGKSLLFVGNSNLVESRSGNLEFSKEQAPLVELISERPYTITNHRLEVTCAPGECLLFEIPSFS